MCYTYSFLATALCGGRALNFHPGREVKFLIPLINRAQPVGGLRREQALNSYLFEEVANLMPIVINEVLPCIWALGDYSPG